MRSIATLLLTLLSLSGCSSTATATPSPTKSKKLTANGYLDLFQKAWNDVSSYQAKFEQKVSSKKIPGEPDITSGTFSLAKPNRLRWESETDETLQILNGETLTVVRKNKRRGSTQVEIHSKLDLKDQPALGFLTGNTKFKEIYRPSIGGTEGTEVSLKLTPRKTSPDTYTAVLDKTSGELLALKVDSPDSSTEVRFSEPKKNEKLADSLFLFVPEPDAVVTRH